MNKHRLNIFPEAKPEDYARLLDDIRTNGFDPKQPITLYQGEILDGWNRQRACDEAGVAAHYTEFVGSDSDAIAFVMRTNKRRNLNSGQWAIIANEAEDLVNAIAEQVERDRREKQAESLTQSRAAVSGNYFPETAPKTNEPSGEENRTAHKLAEVFPTNRTYINQAAKMIETAPDIAAKVKAGNMTMQDARREVARRPVDDEWLPDERERQEAVTSRGETVVANFQRDKHLIQWAQQNGVLESVNRGTKWGNPYTLGTDGNRDEVCDNYAGHYLPFKPSLLNSLPELRGKVLACHCYPERCHADTLKDAAANEAPE